MLAPLLHGTTVHLTALSDHDISTLARWEENSTFLRLLDSGPARPRTRNAIATWLEDVDKAHNQYMFAIRQLEQGTLLGVIGLDEIEWSNQVGWLSIAIGDPANWGKGYGYEATQLALAFVFHELNLHRLQLSVFSYNAQAIALYEKCGFQREGVYREYIYRDGQRFDMYLYGLLRHEWEASVRGTQS